MLWGHQAANKTPSGTPNMESGPIRIIIVDDNEIYRTGLRDIINRQAGLVVVAEAECGEQALEAVKNTPADLLVLDLSLPKQSGFEVLKKIREISDVKVLVLTIYESQEMIRKAGALGAQGYCVKDVSRDELVRGIKEATAGRFYRCRKSEMVFSFRSGDRRTPPEEGPF